MKPYFSVLIVNDMCKITKKNESDLDSLGIWTFNSELNICENYLIDPNSPQSNYFFSKVDCESVCKITNCW